MGMLDFFKSAPSKDVSVETGGLRDMYILHMEDAAMKGVQPLSFPEFVKMIRAQQEQQKMLQQQQQMRPGMFSR